MDYKISIINFNEEQAQDIVDITADSFKNVDVQHRPLKIDTKKIIRTFSAINPGGISIIAYVVIDGKRQACCAAIPFRIMNNGIELIGYQIGSFFVGSKYHGIGLGTKLLKELSKYFDSTNFIFSYPNSRSINIFNKNGYEVTENVPTYIYITAISKILSFNSICTDIVKNISYEEVINTYVWPEECEGLIKDKSDFIWKYFEEDGKYKFYSVNVKSTKALVVIVEHHFMGIKFNIIKDIYCNENDKYEDIIKNLARNFSILSIIYINSSRIKNNELSFIRIPNSINPRPIRLVNRGLNKTTIKFDTITSDWMGF